MLLLGAEQFSRECHSLFWFFIIRALIGSKTFAPSKLDIRSQVKPKPIVTRLYKFSRALRQRHVFD